MILSSLGLYYNQKQITSMGSIIFDIMYIICLIDRTWSLTAAIQVCHHTIEKVGGNYILKFGQLPTFT